MDEIFLVNSSSFQDVEISASLRAGPSIVVDFTQASVVSGSFSGPAQGLTGVSASYIVPSANATASYANTSSWAINAINGGTQISTGSTYPITASWSETSSLSVASVSSSFSTSGSVVQSASYIIPGATFYQVSGSNGVPPSYIEPYDYSKDNVFRPSSKEGRTYWDHKWVNWKVWQDTDYEGSTAAALNLNLGRELNFAVHNPSNATLARGTAVYISGSQTSSIYPFNQTWPQVYKPDVYKALADGTGTKKDVVGLVRSAIPAYHDGYVCLNGTMHNTDVTSYGDVLGTELWLSPTTAGGLTLTKPGQPNEVIKIGYLIETGSQGSILIQVSEEPMVNAYAGMTSVPTITDTLVTGSADFTSSLYVTSASVNLYNNVLGNGIISQYLVPNATVSLAPGGETSYVYATTNGVTASYEITTDLSSINQTNKVPVATVYRADADAHWVILNREGLALANKLNSRLLATEPFSRESGLVLATTGSRFITITEGALWTGATRFVEQPFDSRNSGSDFQSGSFDELHIAYHVGGVWTTPVIASGQYENRYYDDGTDLVALGPDSYSVNYVFRVFGENDSYDEDAFIVLSDAQYATIADAQASNIPANIPAVFSEIGMDVGRIIIQSGSNTASLVESAFVTTFGTSVVTNHENLSGLLGGIGGHYHLAPQEYSDFQGATGTGVYVRATNPSITGSITTASFVTLAQTSSFVTLAQSASYVATASFVETTVSSSYAATASWAINAINGGTSITTGSTYPITASWSVNSINSIDSISSSYASASTSASYSPVEPAYSASAAAYINTKQATLTTGGSYTITASWSSNAINATVATSASYASASISASYSPVEPAYSASAAAYINTKQASLVTGNTYTITASWSSNAVSASYSPVEPAYSSSVSSVKQNTLTAGGSYTITSSWATNATIATSASYASSSTSGSYSVSSSWAANAAASNVFSRGGTFFDPAGITLSTSASIIVWRAPFNCSVTAVHGCMVAQSATATASINARRNGVGTLLANPIFVTASNLWFSDSNAQTASFSTGDRLEIILVSSSLYPTQSSIQVDFIKV